MPRNYVITRENEKGKPDDKGLPVIRNADGEVLSSPYDSSPDKKATTKSKTAKETS